MTWSVFHLFVAAMITFLITLVVLPIWWQRAAKRQRHTTNVALIRQRLSELSVEAEQGLITEHDMRQASDELKLALVEEHDAEEKQSSALRYSVTALIAVSALAIGFYVYSNVNQLAGLKRQQEAVAALPVLSEKLTSTSAANFSTEDVQTLSIAIRQRLRSEPEDAQGWMFLGRLNMSLGKQDEALNALEKAFSISQDPQIATSYIQGLLATGERPRIAQAQTVLSALIADSPENTNYALMMAVASAQLGDLAATERAFSKVDNLLPADNPLKQDLQSRITQMRGAGKSGADESAKQATQVELTIGVDDKIDVKTFPSQGYLVVFAQSTDNENRMPAAVVKLPLPSFPVTVTLSESDAMVAGYSLNTLSEARVVARISADEDVAIAPGEWQGSIQISLRQGQSVQHTLTIDKEL